MKRRKFLTLAGLTAVGAPLLKLANGSAEQSRWRQDGVASVARIGVLTPDFDPVPESELCAMAPPGISIHGSRVSYKRGDPKSFADPPNIDEAVQRLIDLSPRAILYAYTSSSYVLRHKSEEQLRLRLESISRGIPVFLTCLAAIEALRLLNAHRIALIHPPWFSNEVNSLAKDYFVAKEFEVLLCARVTPLRTFTEVSPSEVYEWTSKNVPREAEAVFIGGNGLRSVGTIQALEENLGKPVLTANQVLLWKAARLAGLAGKVTEYGTIFQKLP